MPVPHKSILITGCSSGIGLDAARRMQQRGWQVIAAARRPEDVAQLAAEGFAAVRIDYEEEASIRDGLAAALEQTGGQLGVLFNNGAYAIPGAVEDLPTAALRQIMQANLFGWHELTRAVLPVMTAQGGGRIIQNSSVLGFVGLRFRGAYVASKFALEGLSDVLRLELAGSGVDVVLIEPGPIRTRIRQNSWPHFQKWIDWRGTRLEAVYRDKLIPRLTADNPPPDRFELGPEAVSDALVHACEAGRPRLRYRITRATRYMALAKRMTSSRLLDRLLVRL